MSTSHPKLILNPNTEEMVYHSCEPRNVVDTTAWWARMTEYEKELVHRFGWRCLPGNLDRRRAGEIIFGVQPTERV